MKKLKQLVLASLLVVGVAAVVVPVASVAAADLDPCTLNPAMCAGKETDVNNIFKTIVNVLLFVVGIIAVIMIIISGIRYTASAGNANSVAGAKNTLLYSVIGLVVAIFAYAIINFIVFKATGGTSGVNPGA